MRKDNQILKVPAALEALLTAAAERVAQVESALFLNLPYQSPIGLFKDLVVLFHEQNSSEEPDCFADHEGIITDLKKSFHWELERRATINDLEASKAVALEVLRALSKPEDSTDVVGERGERKAERSGNSTVVSASQFHDGFDLEDSPMHGLTHNQLDAVHYAVDKAIELSSLAKSTGLEKIFQPSKSIRSPIHPPLTEKLAGIFGKNRDLLRILKLLGRLSDAASDRRSKGIRPPTGELYDVQLGAELEMILPAELALMSHPIAKLDFYRRYTERSLLQYSRRPQPDGRGPICVCIDNSYSMAGEKNILAKAMALFCIKHAMSQKRDAMVILFNKKATTHDFPYMKTKIEDIERLLNTPLDLGTRYRTGLAECKIQIDSQTRHKSDIFLIGDAEEKPRPADREWFREFDVWLKQTGTRLFTTHIGNAQHPMIQILKSISRELLIFESLPENEMGDVLMAMVETFNWGFSAGPVPAE